MAGRILPGRHSPGMTQREATRDTSETRCERDSSVREVSCFVPLQRHLHAVCQHGASRKLNSSRIFFLAFGVRENLRKARAISVLALFDLLDAKTRWVIRRAEVIPGRC